MDDEDEIWKRAWQEQDPPKKEEFKVDQEVMTIMSRDAHKLERGVERRNVLEFVAAAAVVGIFGWRAITETGLFIRLGNGVIVASAIFIIFTLFQRGRNVEPPETVSTSAFLDYYRSQLDRQQRLLASVPFWYVAPMAFGMLLVFIGTVLEAMSAGTLADRTIPLALSGGIVLAVLGSVIALNRYGAKKLRQKMEDLDDLKPPPKS